ncbi:hypothetical protein OROHE_009135 [Orobanche hederae]
MLNPEASKPPLSGAAARRQGLRQKKDGAVMAESKEESLCEAARNGEFERVNSLIADGADVTYFDGEGLTPLMHAAKNGCAEVVKALLEGGAPWNALSPSNISAGDFAMDNGHQSAFDVLLNAEKYHAFTRSSIFVIAAPTPSPLLPSLQPMEEEIRPDRTCHPY